jgi:hypothetical protein
MSTPSPKGRDGTDRFTRGSIAYAALNATTEFSTRPPANRCIHRERDSFQRLASEWLNDFRRAFREPGFDLGYYTEKIGKKASRAPSQSIHRTVGKPDQLPGHRGARAFRAEHCW